MTVNQLKGAVSALAFTLEHGCGNHGCRIKPPKGQGTNSICTCTPQKIAKFLLDVAVDCEQAGREWEK